MSRLLLIVSIIATVSANATDFERVLLPVSISNIPGAYGSHWGSITTYRNDGEGDVETRYMAATGRTVLLARTHGSLPILTSEDAATPGQFVYLNRAGADAVHIQTRFGEEHEVGSSGVAIPAVRPADFRGDIVHLLDVPVSGKTRTMLRIYDADGHDGAQVRVIINGFYNTVLADQVVTLSVPFYLGFDPELPRLPAYGQLTDFPSPQAESSSVFVDIIPITHDARIWAFTTTTNNATQAVTGVIPPP